MTREELIGINAIVKMVVDNVIHSPEAIIVVVSTNGHDDVFGFEIHRIAKKQNHRNGGS
jgi:hypothetical protein